MQQLTMSRAYYLPSPSARQRLLRTSLRVFVDSNRLTDGIANQK